MECRDARDAAGVESRDRRQNRPAPIRPRAILDEVEDSITAVRPTVLEIRIPTRTAPGAGRPPETRGAPPRYRIAPEIARDA